MNSSKIIKGYSTPEARWSRLGPYYAMFPLDFAFDVVGKYSKVGDSIIDPFAGRCSSIYAGSVLGRESVGIEINPVGWIYGSAKLTPAPKRKVLERLTEIYNISNNYSNKISQMHEFYNFCFDKKVLQFLLAARENLNWKNNQIDTTLMAIILVYLHGKIGEGLSNQMRMTKSMGMNYSINWWNSNGFKIPPKINPFEFISQKIEWRYAKGIPRLKKSKVLLGDSTVLLDKITKNSKKTNKRYSLLFTSPPYYGLTDYHADQWLRLWLLGGPEIPKTIKDKYKSRFGSKELYYTLLDDVFSKCAKVLETNGVIYVRTDVREFTLNTTIEVLRKHFPMHKLHIEKKPLKKRTQTEIFGNKSSKPGEVDLILTN